MARPDDVGERDAFPSIEAPVDVDLLVGQRVSHDEFGVGSIVDFRGRQPNTRVVIAFDEVGEKQLLLQYATLYPLEEEA